MSHASRAVCRNEKNLGVLSKQYSSRDLPSHMTLKYRKTGQNTVDDLKEKNYKRDLREKERISYQEKEIKKAYSSTYSSSESQLAIASNSTTPLALPSSSKKPKVDFKYPLNIDADDPIYCTKNDDEEEEEENEAGSDNSEEEEEEEDSDEDDTAELLAELNRIKKERAAEEAKKEAEQKAKEEQIRVENILRGNPLTGGKTEFKVKRRWDDDVVFKNCSRDDVDENNKPFINDTLRSEFHKKFMEKYIK